MISFIDFSISFEVVVSIEFFGGFSNEYAHRQYC